jgi:hypothetical protein
MSGVRAQLSWLLRGRATTAAALDALAADLRDLQRKTSELQTAVAQIEARRGDDVEALRHQVAAATDDLTARVAALNARVNP